MVLLHRQVDEDDFAFEAVLRRKIQLGAEEFTKHSPQKTIRHACEHAHDAAPGFRCQPSVFPEPVSLGDVEVRLPLFFGAGVLGCLEQDVTIRLMLPAFVGRFRNRCGSGGNQAVKVGEIQFSSGDHQKIDGIAQKLFSGTEPVGVLATAGFPVGGLHHRTEQVDQIFGIAGTLALARLLIAEKIEAMGLAFAEDQEIIAPAAVGTVFFPSRPFINLGGEHKPAHV
ncbi:MAG: hypothetical protein ABIS50_03735 [Luteolibacter sp.]|uniref:hypothetical protein n=1 Tax=Luteolibacter sp. TaxID=1962973 RepID=UPI0032653F0B